MPLKDGLVLLKDLRKQGNDIPFILFTGKGREEVAIKALNLGADAYHNKQGSPETVYGELAHSIKLVAGHRRIKREIEERDNRLKKLASQTPGMLYQFVRRLTEHIMYLILLIIYFLFSVALLKMSVRIFLLLQKQYFLGILVE